MKSIMLIGLGRFGKQIAMNLRELNHQVMAVDHKEERVQEVLSYVTNAQIGDSTNEDFSALLAWTITMCALWPSETISKAPWKPPLF